MTSDATDWPLVAAGDHAAFARIFDRHVDLVFKFARRRVGDPTIAEDITSQVFLETWHRREDVALFAGSLRAWLIGVARNLQRRHWRTNERRNRATERMTTPIDTTDPSDAIADHLDAVNDLADIRHQLDSLPEAHREILLLAVWDELSYAEIAIVLDVPVGTVRSRLARARQKLEAYGTRTADRASTRRSSNSLNDDPDSPNIERTPR